MKPGDTIKHIPSGERWVVAAASPDEKWILCCGWPETMAPVTDCELVKECSDEKAVELSLEVQESCRGQLRGAWAREWLDKQAQHKTGHSSNPKTTDGTFA